MIVLEHFVFFSHLTIDMDSTSTGTNIYMMRQTCEKTRAAFIIQPAQTEHMHGLVVGKPIGTTSAPTSRLLLVVAERVEAKME